MIDLAGISKRFNEAKPNEITAVNDVTLSLAENAITVIKGPSGSGKTTLLTLIGCLARPTMGRISIRGEAVSGLPEAFLAAVRRSTFGFVFQNFQLIRGLSAKDNVMIPAFPLGLAHRMLTERAEQLLTGLGLAGRLNEPVEYLSGGEAQRVAIARALINDPAIVIADEPTANLDTDLTHRFLDIIATMKAEGRTVLMTSHDPRISGADLVDTVVEMRDGRVMDVAS